MAHGPDSPDLQATLRETVAFLQTPASFPDAPHHVEAQETRMSWVFLTDHFAYKLKKPATTSHFDFSTPALRRDYCENEVRLNARLAPGIYLGVVPILRRPDGRLHIDGDEGEAVDWLVRMRRLPAERMLDATIQAGTLHRVEIEALADRLAMFYTAATPIPLAEADYLARFTVEQATTRALLRDARFGLAAATVEVVLGPVDAVLQDEPALLTARLAAGRIVEGHGDLRPEHVYLGQPPAVIDCLEFSRQLRLLDPFEELAFLGMECAALGDAWVGPLLVTRCATRMRDSVPDRLTAFYAAFRAGLRARQAIAHLLDSTPRTPAKWLPQAQRYLEVGAKAAVRLRAGATR